LAGHHPPPVPAGLLDELMNTKYANPAWINRAPA
jgi:hypothetical protein